MFKALICRIVAVIILMYPMISTAADIVIRRSDDGRWFSYSIDGTEVSTKGRLDVSRNFSYQLVAREDFDGDGSVDLLLRDLTGLENGRWVLYTVQSQTITSRGFVSLTRNADWVLEASADFDGDNKSDLLLRHKVSGKWLLYLLDGHTIKAQGQLPLTPLLTDRVLGTGDFDGDGNFDVLTRSFSGHWKLFLFDGLNDPTGLNLPFIESQDQMQAIADFNGDGMSDILARDSSGRWTVYLMNGGNLIESGSPDMTRNIAFHLVAATDFSGDGKTDVLLRRYDGRWFIYLLDGTSIISGGNPDLTENLDFALVAAEDFDSDGKTDLLMRRSDGRWIVYLMDGSEVSAKGPPRMTRNLAWQPVEITEGAKMEFVVNVPANTPVEDSIYLQSDYSNHASFPLDKVGENRWSVTISQADLILSGASYHTGTGELNYAYTRGMDGNNIYIGGEYFDSPPLDNWAISRSATFAAGTSIEDTVLRWRFSPADGESQPTIPSGVEPFVARLDGAEFQTGTQIADYWPWLVPEDERSGRYLMDSTSRAIKAANSRWVQIAPPWDVERVFPSPVLHAHTGYAPHADGSPGVPSYQDGDLRRHIRNLKSHGFNVILRVQLCCNNPVPDDIADADPAWWNAWFSELARFIQFHAQIAEEEGVSAIVINLGWDITLSNTSAPVDTVQRWEALATAWKSLYSGPVGYEVISGGPCCPNQPVWDYVAYAKQIKHVFDFLGVSIWSGIAAEADASQQTLDANAEALFADSIDPIYADSGLPIIIPSLHFASYDGGAMNTETEPALEIFFPESFTNLTYDGIEQAMAIKAVLKAISSRPHITGLYSFGYNWVATPLGPGPSVRGKPAERLLADWYDSINQPN